MADRQTYTAQERDNALTNGRNKLDVETAMLYNLVRIRQAVTLLTYVVLGGVVAGLIVGILILVRKANV